MNKSAMLAHVRCILALCPCYRNDVNAFVGEGDPADWFVSRLNTLYWVSCLTPRQQRVLEAFYADWHERAYERDVLQRMSGREGVSPEIVRIAYHEALSDLGDIMR